MANVNKVILIGRLTRDPETRNFSNGGKVAKFGFVVNNRRKNSQTGEWEDEPMFLDCEAYNRGDYGKLADRIESLLHKGSQVYIEGRLHLETWDDKNGGGKRSKHKLVVEVMELLDRRVDDSEGGGGRMTQPSGTSGSRGGYTRNNNGGSQRPVSRPEPGYAPDEGDDFDSPGRGSGDEEIPF